MQWMSALLSCAWPFCVGMFIHSIRKVKCWSAWVNTAPITMSSGYVTAQNLMNHRPWLHRSPVENMYGFKKIQLILFKSDKLIRFVFTNIVTPGPRQTKTIHYKIIIKNSHCPKPNIHPPVWQWHPRATANQSWLLNFDPFVDKIVCPHILVTNFVSLYRGMPLK